MNRLEELYEVTKQLQRLVTRDITTDNRQEIIEEVNRLVELRGNYMSELKAPYTEEENQLGEMLLPMNRQIQQKLDGLFASLKEEMKQIKQQKKSAHSYTSPYERLGSADGMFMDRKE